MNKENEKISLLESFKIILVLLTIFLVPGSIVGFLFKMIGAPFLIGLIVSILVELILIFSLGLHKSAYNNNNEDDDE